MPDIQYTQVLRDLKNSVWTLEMMLGLSEKTFHFIKGFLMGLDKRELQLPSQIIHFLTFSSMLKCSACDTVNVNYF